MKRKREMVESKTEIKSAIEELSLLVKIIRTSNNNDDDNNNNQAQFATASGVAVAETTDVHHLQRETLHHQQQQQQHQQSVCDDLNIPTKPFLSVCTLIIQVLDKIGPTMAVMRQDIYNNIQRLEILCESNPTTYSNLVEMLKKEAVERCAKKGDSCSKALVWLTRALDFTAALLQKLVAEPSKSMEQIVENSYETTLKPWHGWISAAASKVALKLLPETDTFINLLMDKGESVDNFRVEIQAFISLLESLLEDLHSTLKSYGLERLKST